MGSTVKKWHLSIAVALGIFSAEVAAQWVWRDEMDTFQRDKTVTINMAGSSTSRTVSSNVSGNAAGLSQNSISQPRTVLRQSSNASTKFGLALWLDASTPGTVQTTSSGYVTSWASKYGSAISAVPVSLTTAPSLVSNAIYSRPAIRFDGASSYLTVPLPDSANFSVFVVGRFRSAASGPAAKRVVIGRGGLPTSGAYWAVLGLGDNPALQLGAIGSGGYAAVSTANANLPWLVTMTHDNSNPIDLVTINGLVQTVTTGTRTALDAGSLVIGADPAITSFSGVDIGEVRVFSRKLSAADHDAVKSEMMGKWSISPP